MPRVYLYDLDGRPFWECSPPGRNFEGRLVWSPDGRWIASASGIHLALLDAGTGKEAARARLKIKHYQDIAFTPDGRFLAGVSNVLDTKVQQSVLERALQSRPTSTVVDHWMRGTYLLSTVTTREQLLLARSHFEAALTDDERIGERRQPGELTMLNRRLESTEA